MPIITNYFTELDTGHKDFVRSFVHLKQSGVLPFGKGALKKFGQENELDTIGDEKVNFNSEMNEGKDRLPTKDKEKRPSGKGSRSGSANDVN